MSASEPATEVMMRLNGRVATLGMFIIDQFQTTDEDGTMHDSPDEWIGGGGVYAMICARLFLPARSCSMIIDTGHDFPVDFRQTLESYGKDMTWFRPREGLTTRALNIYSGSEIGEGHQSFKYLAPQLQLHLEDLLTPPSPFRDPAPEWVHIVCVTQRAKAIVREREAIRISKDQPWSGKLVWEPLPKCCVPDEILSFVELSPYLAVISPNLLELQTLLCITPSAATTPEDVELAARRFHDTLRSAITTDTELPAIIVRAGRLGSYTLSTGWTGWISPYFSNEEQERVVDPTGGGNGFLGGLCAGLLVSGGDMRLASVYAATAASFAIEQRGLPRLETREGREVWNRDTPERRLDEMRRRHGIA